MEGVSDTTEINSSAVGVTRNVFVVRLILTMDKDVMLSTVGGSTPHRNFMLGIN